MIPITVLVSDSTDRAEFACAKGLSFIIHTKEQEILFDTGPNAVFMKNAKKLDIELEKVDSLLISHSHKAFCNGLKYFCKINKNAQIVMENTDSNRYFKIDGKRKKELTPKFSGRILPRIRHINNPAQITTNSWFIPCTVKEYGQPKKNSLLFKMIDDQFSRDNFSHEGIFVIDDSGELVIFNSCSHNGVVNSIESARRFFPNKRIRSYVGGMHFPYGKEQTIPPDDMRNLEELVDYAKQHPELRFYTGHCTGEGTIKFLQKELGKNKVLRIQSGHSYSV